MAHGKYHVPVGHQGGLEGTGATGVQLKAFLSVWVCPGRDHPLDGSEAPRSCFWDRDTVSITDTSKALALSGALYVHHQCLPVIQI